MRKFDGILICTDLDGTLLKNDKTISEKNIKAIEYFKSEGGIFTIITGRMPFFVSDICACVKPNVPIGCINGVGLYDYDKKEYLWTEKMHKDVMALVECADKKFENIGIQVNTFNNTFFYKENLSMKKFREVTGCENLTCDYRNISEPVSKIIFGSEDEAEITELEKTLKEHPLADNFDFIRSEKSLYEILPKKTGKGKAVEKLIELMHIDKNKTIAVGDYNNDISMFEAVKAGIAVSNACREALESADYVTVSNEEDAIAEIIKLLEKDGIGGRIK